MAKAVDDFDAKRAAKAKEDGECGLAKSKKDIEQSKKDAEPGAKKRTTRLNKNCN